MQLDRSFSNWKEELEAARCRWETKYRRDEGALLRGAPLTEAQEWLQNRPGSIEPAERHFIEQSLARQELEETQQQHQWERTIEALCGYSEQSFAAGQELDALVKMLRVAKELKQKERSQPVRSEIKIRVTTLLRKIVYEIRECNRLEHDRQLTRVVLSPNRQIVAAASRDWTIKVWNLEGRELATLEGHGDSINSLAFAPDGQTLASASEDSTVKLWSLDGTELATLKVPRSDIDGLVFSPDGQTLATYSSWDRIIQLWSLDGTLLATIKNQAALRLVCFSPDSQMLAAVNYKQTILLWKLDGTQLATFESISQADDEANSSDYQSLAAGSDRTTWTRQRKKRKLRQESKSRIYSLAFSPDGQVLLAGTDGGTIERWQIGLSLLALENVELPALQGHTAGVQTLIFSPDGETLASGSMDDTVKLWNPDGSLQATLTGRSDYAKIVFSPNGKKLFATARNEAVKFWKLDRIGEQEATQKISSYSLLKHKPGNWHISFSPASERSPEEESEPTFLCHQGKNIGLWNLGLWNQQKTVSERVLKKYDEQSQEWESVSSSSITFSPDGQILATASNETLKLWSREDKELATLTGHSDQIEWVTFSPDGRLLASASKDKTVKLWSREGTEVATLTGHDSAVIRVAFSPDGQLLASVDWDGTIKLWQLDLSLLASGGIELNTLAADGALISCLIFSPDGQTLVAGNDRGTIEILALDGTKRATLAGHRDGITNLAFAPDGQTLASSSRDRTIKLWKLDGTELETLAAHEEAVTCIAFHPDGSAIASASKDGTVKLLQLNGKEITTFHECCCCPTFTILGSDGTSEPPSKKKPKRSEFVSLAFSPDGRVLADSFSCGGTSLWNLDLDDLLVRGSNLLHDYFKNHPQVRV